MSLDLELPEIIELRPRITVVGVGGAGGNAINNMIAAGLDGVDFVVANTDAQALAISSAEQRIQLGRHLTDGLGAGSKPEIGEAAAEEAIEEIKSILEGSHMVFVAAGMGGGTGTGAAAVVARASRDLGILTVGVVTKPFQFEGARRMRIAEQGITEMREHVDTLIVIPNQNLFRIATEKTTFAQAFVLADQVLHAGVACITDLIVREGLINLDFADVNTVMKNMGSAMMGTGEAEGDRRAIEAAEEAIANPLLSELSMKGAKGLLVSITGGDDMTLYEVDEAASRVREEVDPEANIIVGATFDSSLTNRLRVSIVASGIMSKGAKGAHGASGGQPAADSSPAAAPPVAHAPRPATQPAPGTAAPAQPGAPVASAGPMAPPAGASRPMTPPARPRPGSGATVTPPVAHAPRPATPPAATPAPAPTRLVEKIDAGTPSPVVPRTIALEHSDEVRPTETWDGPGAVTIEKTAPALAEFTPRAPAAIERRPQAAGGAPSPSRAVSVDDFDAHGQRVYAAKSQGHVPGARDGTPKKPGFFARLRGKKTRENESLGSDSAEFGETAGGVDRSHEDYRPGDSNVADRSHAVANGPHGKVSPIEDGGEPVDMPDIITKRSA